MAPKQSCPGGMKTGGMECTLEGAEVDEHGVLKCTYTCTVVTQPTQKAELKSLGARAQAAATGLNVKDPGSVRRVNAELKKIRADLEAFAKAYNLKLIKKEKLHKPAATHSFSR
jgi:hypothetical protein